MAYGNTQILRAELTILFNKSKLIGQMTCNKDTAQRIRSLTKQLRCLNNGGIVRTIEQTHFHNLLVDKQQSF
jgi:hypothetical protein